MQLKKVQKEKLRKLSCERLSSNEANKTLIQNFCNNRNEQLSDYIKNEAWDEDIAGIRAVYLVKEGDIVCFYFSLQCGSLFEPLDEDEIKKTLSELNKIFYTLKKSKTVSNKNIIDRNLEIVRTKFSKYFDLFASIVTERQREGNKLVQRVTYTYPGIELVHFCKNDNLPKSYKKEWKSLFSKETLGKVIFWRFVITKILEIRKLIGCQYVFLFAADKSIEESLVSYYRSLKFDTKDDYGTSKPIYDFCCKFMVQKIDDLLINEKIFFDNINPDKEDEII